MNQCIDFINAAKSLPGKHLLVLNTSSASQFYIFQDLSQDVLKTSWKTKSCYAEDVLKTYLEDVFKTSWRQTKCLLVISVSNKSKCVSNKSMFHKSISDKSKANPKCVTENPIISTFILFWNLSSISILTLSWRRSLSYRNQSIDLQSKSVDWFLYASSLRHDRVKN